MPVLKSFATQVSVQISATRRRRSSRTPFSVKGLPHENAGLNKQSLEYRKGSENENESILMSNETFVALLFLTLLCSDVCPYHSLRSSCSLHWIL